MSKLHTSVSKHPTHWSFQLITNTEIGINCVGEGRNSFVKLQQEARDAGNTGVPIIPVVLIFIWSSFRQTLKADKNILVCAS